MKQCRNGVKLLNCKKCCENCLLVKFYWWMIKWSLKVRGSPKIYPKVQGARPEDVESGLTLEHVGSDGVAEASNTAPTRMQPDKSPRSLRSGSCVRCLVCPLSTTFRQRRIFVGLLRMINFGVIMLNNVSNVKRLSNRLWFQRTGPSLCSQVRERA